MALIDPTSGKVRFSVSLASAPGVPGIPLRVHLNYDSAIRAEVTTWNAEMPTGNVGLGWTFTWPQIIRSPVLNSGAPEADVYSLVGMDGQGRSLKCVHISTDGLVLTFQTDVFARVTYERALERWTVVEPDGSTLVFGGDESTTSFGVMWGGTWLAPSIQTANQIRFARRWHLATRTNMYGQSLRYGYTTDLDDEWEIGTNGQVFTRDKRLARIDADAGYSLVFHYGLKDVDECIPDRSDAPGNATTRAVSAYQDLSERHFLSSVDVLNPGGILVRRTLLDYHAQHLNSEHPQMVKRLLKSITRVNAAGRQLRPPTVYDYYGRLGQKSEDFHFDVSPANSVTLSNGGFYGALRTVTTPSGATRCITYAGAVVGQLDTIFDIPSGHHAPRVRFGQDYVLFSYQKDNSPELRVDVWQWLHGSWQIAHTVDNIRPLVDDRGYLMIETQADFFALGCPNATDTPVIHYKDPLQNGVWRTTGTQPEIGPIPKGHLVIEGSSGSASTLFTMMLHDVRKDANDIGWLYRWSGPRVQDGGDWVAAPPYRFRGADMPRDERYHFTMAATEHNVIVATFGGVNPILIRCHALPDGTWDDFWMELDPHYYFKPEEDYFALNFGMIGAGANFAAVFCVASYGGDSPGHLPHYSVAVFDWCDGDLRVNPPFRHDLNAGANGSGVAFAASDCVVDTDIGLRYARRHDGANWISDAFDYDFAEHTLAPGGLGTMISCLRSNDNKLSAYVPRTGSYAGQNLVDLPDTPSMFADLTIIEIFLAVAATIVMLGIAPEIAPAALDIAATVAGPALMRRLCKPSVLSFQGPKFIVTSILKTSQQTKIFYKDPFAPITPDGDRAMWRPLDLSGFDLRTHAGASSFTQFGISNDFGVFESVENDVPASTVCLMKNGCLQLTSDGDDESSGLVRKFSGYAVKPPNATPTYSAPGMLVMYAASGSGRGDDARRFRLMRLMSDSYAGALIDAVAVSVSVDDGYQVTRSHVDYALSVGDSLGWERDQAPVYGRVRTAAGRLDFASSQAAFGHSETLYYTGRNEGAPLAPESNVDQAARRAASRPYLSRMYNAAGNLVQQSLTTWQVFALGPLGSQPVQPWMETVRVDAMADGTLHTTQYEYEQHTCGALRRSVLTGAPVPGFADGAPEMQIQIHTFGWEKYPELAHRHVLTPVVQTTEIHQNTRAAWPMHHVAWSFTVPNTRATPGAGPALYSCPDGIDCIAPGCANLAYVPGRPLTSEFMRLSIFRLYRDKSVQIATVLDAFNGTRLYTDTCGPLAVDPRSATVLFTGNACIAGYAPQLSGRPELLLQFPPLLRMLPKIAMGWTSPDRNAGVLAVYAADPLHVYAATLDPSSPSNGLALTATMSLADASGNSLSPSTSPAMGSAITNRVFVAGGREQVGELQATQVLGLMVEARIKLPGRMVGSLAVLQEPARYRDIVFGYMNPASNPASTILVASSFSYGTPCVGRTEAGYDLPGSPIGDPVLAPGANGVYVLCGDNSVRLLSFVDDGHTFKPAWAKPFQASGRIQAPASIDGEGNLLLRYLDAMGKGCVVVVSMNDGALQSGPFSQDNTVDVQEAPVFNPISNDLVTLGRDDSGDLSLIGIAPGPQGDATSVQVTTWNTAQMLPDASYVWKGKGSPDFWTTPDPSADWRQTVHLTLAHEGIPLEHANAEGVVSTTRYDSTYRLPIAQFINASGHTGEGFFSSFESYEDLSKWPLGEGCVVDDTDSWTGLQCLQVKPWRNVVFTLGDAPLAREPGALLVGLWYKTDAVYDGPTPMMIGLTLDGVHIGASQPLPDTHQAWKRLVLAVDTTGYVATGCMLGLAIGNETSPARVWIDHLWVTPLTSSFSASVYDPVLRVVTEQIDRNGNVSRTVYDPLLRHFGSQGPDRLADGASASFFSRDGSPVGGFDAQSPNSVLSLVARTGGTHFRFRTPADTEGWRIFQGSGSFGNGVITLNAGDASAVTSRALPEQPDGMAVRAWIETEGENAAPFVSYAGFQARYDRYSASYVFTVRGGYVASALAPLGKDWLLAISRDPDEADAACVTVCVDGCILFSTALALNSTDPLAGTQVVFGVIDGAATISRVFFFIDPVLDVAYSDGAGGVRQSQQRESASTITMSEQLYDTLGRKASATVDVRKQDGATNASGFAFEQQFVADRNPDDAGSLWVDGEIAGPMAGLVRTWWTYPDWSNPDVRAADRDYPYTGAVFGKDALDRPAQTVTSASEFKAGTPHAPRYDYGGAAVPPSPALMDLMQVEAQDRSRYTVSDNTHALSDTDFVRTVSVTDSFGRGLISGVWHGEQASDQMLSGMRHAFGADGGEVTTALMPNAFVSAPGTFTVESRSNALGELVQTTTPDSGTTERIHDKAGRVRFTRDARGAAEGYFITTSYDPLGRPVEQAIVVGADWDRAVLTEAAEAPAWQLRQGLPAAWSLAQDSGTSAVDSSGFEHAGELRGSAAWAAGSPDGSGHCLALARTNGTCVAIAGSPPLLGTHPKAFSWAAWIRMSELPTVDFRNEIVRSCDADAEQSLFLHVAMFHGEPQLRFGLQDYRSSAATAAVQGFSASDLKTWIHVVGVFDGTALQLFKDGVAGTRVPFDAAGLPVQVQWTLGAEMQSGKLSKGSMPGDLSDVRIYARALSPGEVMLLRLEGLGLVRRSLRYDDATAPAFPLGQLAESKVWNDQMEPAGPDAGLVVERMTYDAMGRTLSHALTVPDYDAVERVVRYEYDNLGHVTRVTAPLE